MSNTLEHTIYYGSKNDTIKFTYLTDTHLGNRAVDEPLLLSDIRKIKNEGYYWIGGGDYIDGIPRKGDKRYQESIYAEWLHGVEDPLSAQIEKTIELLSPIADRCLGLVSGNHEWAALRHNGRDAYSSIVKGLASAANKKPEDLLIGSSGFVVIKFIRKTGRSTGNHWNFTVRVQHGFGGGRKRGGDALHLEYELSLYDCDLFLTGHRHKRVFTDGSFVDQSGNVQYRLGMIVPSYLRNTLKSELWKADTYSEMAGYRPEFLGAIPITIWPFRKRFGPTLVNQIGL